MSGGVGGRSSVGRGERLLASGDALGAEEVFRGVLARRGDDAGALLGLGRALLMRGMGEEAEAVLARAARRKGRDPEVRFEHARALQRLGRVAEAEEAYRAAIAARPGFARAYLALAQMLEQSGRREEAGALAKTALSIDPSDPVAVTMRARSLRREGDAGGAEALARGYVEGREAAFEKVSPMFELGLALEELGREGEAFDTFEEAQRLRRGLPDAAGVSGAEPVRLARETPGVLTAERVEAWSAERFDDGLRDPAFLVGFPRSGTTLTERVLAAHEGVVTIDERPVLGRVVGRLGQSRPLLGGYPGSVAKMSASDALAMRRVYAEEAAAAGFDLRGDALVVDKLPLNILNLPLILRLFPRARVMVALRDARGVVLSCIRQEWRPNPAMVHLMGAERAAAFYAEVMGMWAEVRGRVLGERVAEVRYEETVDDFEGSARRLVAFLGLEWDEAVLAFHERSAGEYVSTPSYEAVGRAVTGEASARWKRYAGRLEAVEPVLRPVMERLGYG